VNPSLRVLLIDDNPHDRALVESELRREFPDLKAEQVTDGEGFDRALGAGGFDLVITDYQLRWTDGLAVVRAVKSRFPDCPVIMFTGTGSEEVAVEAMKAGLDDYVLKSPKHLVRLSATVRLALERAESRRRAARLEVRLEALLNRLNVGVFRSMLDGQVLEANPAFWRLLGLDHSQASGGIDLNAFYEGSGAMGLLEEAGHLREREVQLRRADGDRIWVSLTETLNAVPGRGRFIDGLMEDITGRKQAEEALARQAEELARSNDELQRFAYVVSHDLKEPLRTVSSRVQLLARRYRGRLESDADGLIGEAVDGVARMEGLIGDLLEYARVTALERGFKPVDCEVVFDRVLASLRAAVEEAGAVVTRDALPTVVGDDAQLTQVFQNLIGNGIKFQGEDPPWVHVSARRNGKEWVFAVRDNGIGIDPDYHERIFEVFRRLHTRAEYPGTGLGLAICKKIVERHGGRIRVESEPQKGATFYFTLPAGDTDP